MAGKTDLTHGALRALHPHPDLPPSRGKEESESSRTQRARDLRANMTDAERRLWQGLRGRQLAGYKFRRQVPIGPYIVDFACLEARLVIEVDGGQHLGSAEDQARDAWLRSEGYRVLRFWNHEVLQQTTDVLEHIWNALNDPASIPLGTKTRRKGMKISPPSPLRGEGRGGGEAGTAGRDAPPS